MVVHTVSAKVGSEGFIALGMMLVSLRTHRFIMAGVGGARPLPLLRTRLQLFLVSVQDDGIGLQLSKA